MIYLSHYEMSEIYHIFWRSQAVGEFFAEGYDTVTESCFESEGTVIAAAFSIKHRNILGNIATGCCLIALGALRLAAPDSLLFPGLSIVLLVLAGFNLWACLSKSREREDEMSAHNSGRASAFALWFTLVGIGASCAFGLVLDAAVDLGSASFLAIGLAMATYGIAFAWLERSM